MPPEPSLVLPTIVHTVLAPRLTPHTVPNAPTSPNQPCNTHLPPRNVTVYMQSDQAGAKPQPQSQYHQRVVFPQKPLAHSAQPHLLPDVPKTMSLDAHQYSRRLIDPPSHVPVQEHSQNTLVPYPDPPLRSLCLPPCLGDRYRYDIRSLP